MKFRRNFDEISIHELDAVALNWPAAVGPPPVLWWDAAQDRVFWQWISEQAIALRIG